jgi:hypothetical protein
MQIIGSLFNPWYRAQAVLKKDVGLVYSRHISGYFCKKANQLPDPTLQTSAKVFAYALDFFSWILRNASVFIYNFFTVAALRNKVINYQNNKIQKKAAELRRYWKPTSYKAIVGDILLVVAIGYFANKYFFSLPSGSEQPKGSIPLSLSIKPQNSPLPLSSQIQPEQPEKKTLPNLPKTSDRPAKALGSDPAGQSEKPTSGFRSHVFSFPGIFGLVGLGAATYGVLHARSIYEWCQRYIEDAIRQRSGGLSRKQIELETEFSVQTLKWLAEAGHVLTKTKLDFLPRFLSLASN